MLCFLALGPCVVTLGTDMSLLCCLQPCVDRVEGCNTMQGLCTSEHSGEYAFDDSWHGPGKWDTCGGPDKSVIVNVTRPNGIPSVDGIFMRLAENPSPDGARFKLMYSNGGSWTLLGSFEFVGGSKDVAFSFATGGIQGMDLWKVDFEGSPICPSIIEIGFNGTCEVCSTPATHARCVDCGVVLCLQVT